MPLSSPTEDVTIPAIQEHVLYPDVQLSKPALIEHMSSLFIYIYIIYTHYYITTRIYILAFISFILYICIFAHYTYIKVDPDLPAVIQGNWMTMPRSTKLDVNLTQKLGFKNTKRVAPRSQTKLFLKKMCNLKEKSIQ